MESVRGKEFDSLAMEVVWIESIPTTSTKKIRASLKKKSRIIIKNVQQKLIMKMYWT